MILSGGSQNNIKYFTIEGSESGFGIASLCYIACICDNILTYRIKANRDDNNNTYKWETGSGDNDCIVSGNWDSEILGNELVNVEPINEYQVVITVKEGIDCVIVEACSKNGQDHLYSNISCDGKRADIGILDYDHEISHIELLIRCCGENSFNEYNA